MIESQVEEEIEVEKFGNTIKVIPAFTGHNEEQSNNIIHKLSSRLEQKYPDIFEAMVTYWKELQISVFPFALLMDKEEIWSAVLERMEESVSDWLLMKKSLWQHTISNWKSFILPINGYYVLKEKDICPYNYEKNRSVLETSIFYVIM